MSVSRSHWEGLRRLDDGAVFLYRVGGSHPSRNSLRSPAGDRGVCVGWPLMSAFPSRCLAILPLFIAGGVGAAGGYLVQHKAETHVLRVGDRFEASVVFQGAPTNVARFLAADRRTLVIVADFGCVAPNGELAAWSKLSDELGPSIQPLVVGVPGDSAALRGLAGSRVPILIADAQLLRRYRFRLLPMYMVLDRNGVIQDLAPRDSGVAMLRQGYVPSAP